MNKFWMKYYLGFGFHLCGSGLSESSVSLCDWKVC